MMRRIIILIAIAWLIGPTVRSTGDEAEPADFDLAALSGEWAGSGEAVIPKTRIPLSIEGSAYFAYDSTRQYLRTSVTARKFFFTYADSGHLYHNQETDSIVWDVWDGFGQYGRYFGKINDNVLTGTMTKGKWVFDVTITFVTPDSLTFDMTSRKGEGRDRPRAGITLRRIEEP